MKGNSSLLLQEFPFDYALDLDNSLNPLLLVRFCFATQSVSASRLDKPRSTSVPR